MESAINTPSNTPRRKPTPILFLRTLMFYLGYPTSGILFGAPFPFFAPFVSLETRTRYLLLWNRWTLFWLSFCCGIRYEVSGEIPSRPFVCMSKHQSAWETYYLQLVLTPIQVILKKELLRIPFFGWSMWFLKPIAIDRSDPRNALRQINKEGAESLANGRSVLVFPEGTRVPVGQSGNYARSGANLALRANVPILPVAHNSGVCWPRGFIKYPGTIKLVFGELIETEGKGSRELTEQVEAWIEGEIATF